MEEEKDTNTPYEDTPVTRLRELLLPLTRLFILAFQNIVVLISVAFIAIVGLLYTILSFLGY